MTCCRRRRSARFGPTLLLLGLFPAHACTLVGSGTPSSGPTPSVRPPSSPALPAPGAAWTQTGIASWYGEPFHGRQTASGERYDMNELTCAHPTLPFGSRIRVRNLENGRTVTLRVNDRGPFVQGRIVDVSRKAAEELGIIGSGTARVEITLAGGGGG